MKHLLTFILVAVAFLCNGSPAVAQQLAFPGADGYGRHATGGRGGEVCYVTRLDDCPDNNLVKGTLRWALRHNNGGRPRTILFATSGTIYLTSKLKFEYPNVSILGQSAPGGGITITGFNMYICKNNVIIRHIRFRAGDIPSSSMTGLDMENCQNVILDHCSMTWSMEECLTAYDSKYTTVQWCIIGEGLYNSKNSKGARAYATQWGGEHSTMHHTLITNSHSRAPRFNGARDAGSGHDTYVDSEFANNVVFNWSGSGNQYGGEMKQGVAGYNRVYLINNYYRPGPSTQLGTKNGRYWCAPSTPYGEWYLSGNKFELSSKFAPTSNIWSNAELDKVNADNYYGAESGNGSRGINLTGSNFTKYVMKQMPYELSGMEYESADDAYAAVTTKAGASLPRYDEVDRRLLDEAAGKVDPKYHGPSIQENGIIDSPADITLANADEYVVNGIVYKDMPRMFIQGTDKYFIDSDADGMPDAYEDEKGFDKNDAADGAADSGDGYTNLEVYLNAIADGVISPSKYCTSLTYVEPGPETPAPDTVTYTFSKGTATGVQGTAPAAVTAQYGAAITIPENHTLYREGYTLTHWTSGKDMTTPCSAYMSKADVTLTPSFTANTKAVEDRKHDIVITWDFTVADAPQSLEGNGIFVAQGDVEGEMQDFKLSYSDGVITIPACESACYSLVGATTVEGEADDATLEVDAPEALQSVTVTLPYVKPQVPTSGSVTATWPWEGQFTSTAEVEPKNIFTTAEAELGSMLQTNGAAMKTKILPSETLLKIQSYNSTMQIDDNSVITFTLQPADGIAFRPERLSFNAIRCGTGSINYTVTLQQGSGTEVMVIDGKNPNRDNDDPATTPFRPDNIDLTKYSLTSSAEPLVVRMKLYNFFQNEGVPKDIAINKFTVSGTFDGKVPEEGGDDGDNEDEEYDIAGGEVFTDGPYQAVVRNAEQLTQALADAKRKTTADSKLRYRIFLKNGTYDFGKTAKTTIPQHTSLIGESMDGVLIMNNPGVVSSSYQEKTPVLFIDQNQEDVYLQDVTIRQARDWATKTSAGQALALRQRSKHAMYKNVSMQGVQDTYYLNKADGTAYFEDCVMAGEVDFIYGDGTMWFEHCTLLPVSSSAIITAPNTQPGYKGIIFSNCTIDRHPEAKGNVTGYALGRPWGDSPASTYLNTTMLVQPVAAGWKAMQNGLKLRFHEYGSVAADGSKLDLSQRSITGCNPAAGSDNPVLSDDEAAAYTIANVFGTWNPQQHTAQLDAPDLTIDGETISWPAVTGAYAYAVCRNGKVIGFTTDTTYHLPAAGTYTIRVANQMGGLGPQSVNGVTGISEATVSAPVAKGRYNISGQRVSESYTGIVISNGSKYIK